MGLILTVVDKKILPKYSKKTKLTKTHQFFVKNTVVVFLLVVKTAAPPDSLKIKNLMTLYLFREKGITNIGTETNERILSLVSSLMNPVPELRPSARQLLQVISTF